MKEQKSAGLEREEGPGGGAGEAIRIIQPEDMAERPRWREGGEGPLRKVQNQGFLEGMDSPHTGWRKEPSPWEDAKAFLASFEQVAKACQWPRKEWAARLLPALSGEAQQAFGTLEARDREDYGKVKAAILRWEANRMETLRQHFRQFRSREVEDPRRIYSQLQELCCQWLRPERHSKEQILELLILEQFLAILPPELQRWIRAGCPENCTQAAALVDVFLMNHNGGAETWKWQGPLREVGSLNAEEESLDPPRRKVYKEALQNSEGEIHLLGRGSERPGHFSPSLPPEGQETAEAGQAKKPMNLGATDVVKQSLTEPGQRTMFWQVLQEDGGNVDTLEGFLVPKSGLASHLEKEEEMLVQFLEKRERLTGQDPGDVKRIKKEDSEEEESGPDETWESLTEATQVDIPGTSEIHKQRCESQGLQVKKDPAEILERLSVASCKMYTVNTEGGKPTFSKYGRKYKPGLLAIHTDGNPYECPVSEANLQQKCFLEQHEGILTGKKQLRLYECLEEDDLTGHQSQGGRKGIKLQVEEAQYGRRESEETHRTVLHLTQQSMLKPAEIQEQACKSRRQYTAAKITASTSPKGSPGTGEDTVADRHDTMPVPENFHKCLMRGGDFHPSLHKHQRIPMGEKCYEFSHGRRSFLQREHLIRHQRRHTRKKTYECPDCGKSLRSSGSFKSHQRIHTGERPYGCSYCAKSFNQSIHLERHQKVHTGEKPYGCPECGRSFSRKDTLIKHQRTHTGHQQIFDCGS